MSAADTALEAEDWHAAVRLYTEITRLNARDATSLENLAIAYYSLGRYELAAAALEKALPLLPPGSRSRANALFNFGATLALAGQTTKALAALEQAADAGADNGEDLLRDRDLDSLRAEPRFQRLVQRLFGRGYTGFDTLGPTTEQMRSGIQLLVETIAAKHPNPYRHYSPDEWWSLTRDALERVPTVDEAGYYALLRRLAGLAGDAHTVVYPRRGSRVLRSSFDIVVWRFADGLFIRAAGPSYRDLVGSKVLALEGVPAAQAWERLVENLPAENLWMSWYEAAFHMQFPAYLYALGLGESPEKGTWELLMPDGARRKIELRAVSSEGFLKARDRSLGFKDTDGWSEGHDGLSTPPLWLKHRNLNYWYEQLQERDAVYMNFASSRYDTDRPYERFLNEMFDFIRRRDDVERLVIDLRLNEGGWDYMIQPLLHHIIRTPKIDRPGHLFVLIGRLTQSAGVTAVVTLAHHTHAIFVGEPVGAHPNLFNGPWGNHPPRALPGTDLVFRVSTLEEQVSDAVDDRHFIAPEIAAQLTFAAYEEGGDPALEAALAVTPEQGREFFVDAGGRDLPLYLHWLRPSQLGTQEPAAGSREHRRQALPTGN